MKNQVQANEKKLFHCPCCLTEFEVILKTTHADKPSLLTARFASFCPFCGKQAIEEV